MSLFAQRPVEKNAQKNICVDADSGTAFVTLQLYRTGGRRSVPGVHGLCSRKAGAGI